MRRAVSARFVWLPLGIAAVIVLISAGSHAAARPSAASEPPEACGALQFRAPRVSYDHVIWIWMENRTYATLIGPPGSAAQQMSPYLNALASGCGIAANYHNLTHPSLPNYVAATAGSLQGVTGNCTPSACPLTGPNLFGQVIASGRAWRAYMEGMPTNCALRDSGRYSTLTNPAVYYTDIAAACRDSDVTLGTSEAGALLDALNTDALPAFAFIVPDMCNNSHDCEVATSDAWLSTWVPKILATPSFTSGDTVLVITWDEGVGGDYALGKDCTTHYGDQSCHIPALVISPYVSPGTRSSTLFNHYSLLRSTEDWLGLAPLGAAADAATAGMAADFHLLPGAAATAPWRIVLKQSAKRRIVNVVANAARSVLANYDVSIGVQRSGSTYFAFVRGLYTERQATFIRRRLGSKFPRTYLQGPRHAPR